MHSENNIMKRITPRPCGFREADLIAVACDEAEAPLHTVVQAHLWTCQACQRLYDQYQGVQTLFATLQDTPTLEESLRTATARLERVLASQPPVVCLRYCLLASAFGGLCIATSPRGVVLVAWQTKAERLLTTLAARPEVMIQEDGEDLQNLMRELHAYLTGTCNHLDWPLDDRLVHSPFQRAVLQVTADIPYGATMSYQGVAAALGRPQAVRAVAQALRGNPLALVIPCHRVIGSRGHLTGYAGGLETKSRLLAQEGIPLQRCSRGTVVDRAHMYVGWRTERAYCRPQCPSLMALPPGDMLLLSPRALDVQPDFTPCSVCHPDTT
jgi:O-6-methylguanine DNA methyltransferase